RVVAKSAQRTSVLDAVKDRLNPNRPCLLPALSGRSAGFGVAAQWHEKQPFSPDAAKPCT
ncbi:MAG: hypothetical protein KUG59_07505, partial [Parvibaculaceae bacterium]|nr:hypothetical protein [Parvibaculaceae bacterium]